MRIYCIALRAGKELIDADRNHIIEFRNVSFKYSGSDVYALKNINITIPFGQKLSIVGENGAGKTTFVKLMTRMYDSTEGEILLDGVNIKTIDYEQYMSFFSSVFQDYKLFSFSIKDNVAFAQLRVRPRDRRQSGLRCRVLYLRSNARRL